MATRPSQVAVPKPSFASVAAMAPPAQKTGPILVHDDKGTKCRNSTEVSTAKSAHPENVSAIQLNLDLPGSMSRLNMKENTRAANGLSEREAQGTLRPSPKLDDEKTHLSSSSTKPASLDGKSVTSGTTFAMDEKESLRPDDSASVKAAEDDDAYSGPASGAASSRVGSEAGSKAFRDQFYEISERMGPGIQRGMIISRRPISGIQEEGPQGTLAPLAPTLTAPAIIPRSDVLETNGAAFPFNYQDPDEKLFEALESPKDRLFLLRLEQEVINFVKDSQEPILDLPPCNSFCRLLAHKLADYYALTHYVDNAVSAVRLYRTPYCRLPTPLSVINSSVVPADLAISAQPAVKIMRRAGLSKDGHAIDSGADTGASSMAPSKAGSETGDDSHRATGIVSPTDSISARDKSVLTREEREANYRKTRDRIFGDIENSDAPAEPEMSNEVSRTSSTTGKRKTKKNKNNDDGFEARSQFNAYYPNVQYPHTAFNQAPNQMALAHPYMLQSNGSVGHFGMPQSYSQGFQPVSNVSGFSTTMQQHPLSGGSFPYGQSGISPQVPPYGQQMSNQFYQSIPQANSMIQQSSAMSSPALSNNAQLSRPLSQMSEQQWSQNGYQSPYQMFSQPSAYSTQNHPQMQGNIMSSVPYPYGQLPYQRPTQGGRPQHPLPGSFNRQIFNPQTRAFVPGTGPNHSQSGPYLNGNMDASAFGARAAPQGGNGLYPCSHQSIFPPVSQTSAIGQQTYTHSNPANYGTRKTSNQAARSQSPGHNSLSKWGIPATLPPKPPPPEASTSSGNTSIQNMSSGHAMPTFQNGTYSQPSVNT